MSNEIDPIGEYLFRAVFSGCDPVHVDCVAYPVSVSRRKVYRLGGILFIPWDDEGIVEVLGPVGIDLRKLSDLGESVVLDRYQSEMILKAIRESELAEENRRRSELLEKWLESVPPGDLIDGD